MFQFLILQLFGDKILLMKIVIAIVSLQSSLFMFSYFGTKLMEKSAAIGLEIANLPWYNFKSKTIITYLILIQLRAQKPIGITAGKLYIINFKSFRDICNTMYKYFAVLKILFER